MSAKNGNLQRLLKALRMAYLKKESVQPDNRLKVDVMRRIRNLHQEARPGSFGQTLGWAAWKLAPVSVLMILICAYGLLNLELIPDWQILQLMTNGTEEIILFEFLT